MECFICCTSTGKTDNEIANELFINRRTFDYPIIKLSQAYSCACLNTNAHNKCLLNIKKCPTCRKVVIKPNLYVKTKYDYIFGWLFNRIKKNPSLIGNIYKCAIVIAIISLGFYFCIIHNYIKLNVDLKNHIILSLFLIIQLSLGVIFCMKDYFKKYWLYDKKNNIIHSI